VQKRPVISVVGLSKGIIAGGPFDRLRQKRVPIKVTAQRKLLLRHCSNSRIICQHIISYNSFHAVMPFASYATIVTTNFTIQATDL
jgi:hypothetical protein